MLPFYREYYGECFMEVSPFHVFFLLATKHPYSTDPDLSGSPGWGLVLL